ncbi:hypothetical protein Pan258_54150 [Symmachiella dynata]|uniref:hypothetical protein n=1 Tax=Symmachiella dynata TaxID=2527995 RepID=UPI00118D2C31|nr:hypothetical protein [Symmachiella dynata]QDT51326.1 hypothetical protein Pan258_54150 [Symmachiella dynata]
MTLTEYENIISNTGPSDWTVITCWGFGSGHSFLDRTSVWTGGSSEGIEVESHSMRASLKSDLAIWIAWGFPANSDFHEEWANKFTDPSASSSIVDFFYNDAIVYRDVGVHVDGARVGLPLPQREFNTSQREVVRRTVPRNKKNFFGVLHLLESGNGNEYEQYFNDVGFEVIDERWMA